MIIYSSTKSGFLDDTYDKVLDRKLEQALKERLHYKGVGRSEIRSWRNSLEQMSRVLGRSSVPDDAVIALEYSIPGTCKRIDMIVSGLNGEGKRTAVIIELKQWETAEPIIGEKDIVKAPVGGGTNVVHPCYQAWSYAELIRDFNATVREEGVLLIPCAYLHNFEPRDPEPLMNPENSDHTDVRIFWRNDNKKFDSFLSEQVRSADDGATMGMIENGRMSPSKSLQDTIEYLLDGNTEFTLLDSQKVAYEEILSQATESERDGRKRVVIVRGGPGTGKSVLAVNLLNELTQRGMATLYVSRNTAPRYVYSAKLKTGKKERKALGKKSGKNDGLKRNMDKVNELFVGSGSFVGSDRDEFPVLLVDEAHRLAAKSGWRGNYGENQISEIINAGRLSVFFIDERQRVTALDIGTVHDIEERAEAAGAETTHCLLESQFRCGGSDGYIDWLDTALEIDGSNGVVRLDGSVPYDFEVYDDPCRLLEDIRRLNGENGRSRMLAGFCWDWDMENRSNKEHHDVTIEEFGFGMSWNLDNTKTWVIEPDSVEEIGCIYTCQGLELDYVGVIIGDDMRFENGHIVTDASKRSKNDRAMWGLKKNCPDESERRRRTDEIIKNTYKVLLSRGMKGCYVFCTDKALAEHFRSLIDGSD